MNNVAIVDIETGGFSKTKNGLCEIGLLVMDGAHKIIFEQSWVIHPYEREIKFQEHAGQSVSYKSDALAVNGFTIEFLEQNGVHPTIAAQEFISALLENDCELMVAHNGQSFDIPWLEYFCNRFLGDEGAPPIYFKKVFDTLTVAREKLKLPINSLEYLCQHFKIEHNNKHRALGDCHATKELYIKLK